MNLFSAILYLQDCLFSICESDNRQLNDKFSAFPLLAIDMDSPAMRLHNIMSKT